MICVLYRLTINTRDRYFGPAFEIAHSELGDDIDTERTPAAPGRSGCYRVRRATPRAVSRCAASPNARSGSECRARGSRNPGQYLVINDGFLEKERAIGGIERRVAVELDHVLLLVAGAGTFCSAFVQQCLEIGNGPAQPFLQFNRRQPVQAVSGQCDIEQR